MEKVAGIEGVFSRSQDPETLRAWHADNRWVANPAAASAAQEAGPTGFVAVSRDTDHFGDKQQFRVKFRTKTHPRALASFR